MIQSRLALHAKLEEILGNKNVYFQPPATLKYPCIVYSLSKVDKTYADDKRYLKSYVYKITLMEKDPDNSVVDKMLELPYTELVQSFSTQGLNHYVFTTYYNNYEKEI